jgi:hypothetical protein
MSLNMVVDDSNINYEIIVSANISEELNAQIFRYWAYEFSSFKYSIEDIKTKKNKSIISEVLENSQVKITLSHCILCFNSIHVFAKNRVEFMAYLSGENHTCNKCKMFSPNYDENTMQLEPMEVRLNQLNTNKLRVLHGIIKLKRKALIYQHIFNNNIMDNKIWKIVNSLQSKDLIWVERDDEWKIKSFNFNSELANFIDDLNG